MSSNKEASSLCECVYVNVNIYLPPWQSESVPGKRGYAFGSTTLFTCLSVYLLFFCCCCFFVFVRNITQKGSGLVKGTSD